MLHRCWWQHRQQLQRCLAMPLMFIAPEILLISVSFSSMFEYRFTLNQKNDYFLSLHLFKKDSFLFHLFKKECVRFLIHFHVQIWQKAAKSTESFCMWLITYDSYIIIVTILSRCWPLTQIMTDCTVRSVYEEVFLVSSVNNSPSINIKLG